jgi:hypothetical protein
MPHRRRRQNPASREAPHVETGPAPVKGSLRREKRTTREAVTNCYPGGGPSWANLLDIRVLWTLTPPLKLEKGWARKAGSAPPPAQARLSDSQTEYALAEGRLRLGGGQAGSAIDSAC